jgi:hypothetical protein
MSEGTIANEIIRILKEKTGVEYYFKEKPDSKNSETKDIDIILIDKTGRQKVAVEHTTIESFIDQRKYGSACISHRGTLEEKLKGLLPSDKYFFLCLPNEMFRKENQRKLNQVDALIIDWIAKNASALGEREQGRIELPCIGAYAYLQARWHNKNLNGTAIIAPYVSGDLEAQRNDRIDKAIDDKVDKLSEYKTRGFHTILALEDVDIYLSRADLVEASLVRYKGQLNTRIDSIYYFLSNGDNILESVIIKDNDAWFDEIAERIYIDGSLLTKS